jgi:sugar lactone lactonase YvrE
MVGAISSTGLYGPQAVAVDLEHGKLYVGDTDNHRVLRYAYPITANGPTAEVVFGQQSFTTNDPQSFFNATGYWPDPTATQILHPMSLAVDHGDLWVCDTYNSRILKFSSAYSITTNGPPADAVLGQKDFVSRDYSITDVTANSFHAWGIFIDANRTLWVADPGGSRVLRFDNAYTRLNLSDADQVLGQPDFVTHTIPSSPSAGVMGVPTSVWLDGTTLWVCDRDFNRVLRFDNAAAKGNGGLADGVLGQTSFTTGAGATTAAALNRPYSVCVDNARRVYIGDQSNMRIMIYDNGALKADGAPADHLLGQVGFYYSIGRVDSVGFNGSYSLRQVNIDTTNGKLLAVDAVSYRVLVFSASGPLSVGETAPASLPEVVSLSQNYPNPFNPTTVVTFQLPVASDVRLVVYDLLGREVAVLVNEKKASGSYSVRFDATGLASGVYFYRLVAGGYVESRKMLLVR